MTLTTAHHLDHTPRFGAHPMTSGGGGAGAEHYVRAASASLPPDYPATRLQFMLDDSGAATLVTTSRLYQRGAFAALRFAGARPAFLSRVTPGIIFLDKRIQHPKAF